MYVDIARATEQWIFEMMVFQVGNRMRHVVFATEERFFPTYCPIRAANARHALHMGRQLTHQQSRADGADAQFGMRQEQVILTLRDVVGKFIADGKAKTIRLSIVTNEIETGNLWLFTAIEGKMWHRQRLLGSTYDGAVALIKPFRLYTDLAGRRFATFQSHAEHLHAVGQIVGTIEFFMHGIAPVGTTQMRQTSAGNIAMRRIIVIERCEQATTLGHLGVIQHGRTERCSGESLQ